MRDSFSLPLSSFVFLSSCFWSWDCPLVGVSIPCVFFLMLVYFSNDKVSSARNVYFPKKKHLKDRGEGVSSASSYGLMA